MNNAQAMLEKPRGRDLMAVLRLVIKEKIYEAS